MADAEVGGSWPHQGTLWGCIAILGASSNEGSHSQSLHNEEYNALRVYWVSLRMEVPYIPGMSLNDAAAPAHGLPITLPEKLEVSKHPIPLYGFIQKP